MPTVKGISMKKIIGVLSVLVGGCSGFQAPTVVNVNANGGSSSTPVTLSQTNSEASKESAAIERQTAQGTKSKNCNVQNVVCAYQGRGYENADIELTLKPRDIANDGTATLDIKIPGKPFIRDKFVQVGDVLDV